MELSRRARPMPRAKSAGLGTDWLGSTTIATWSRGACGERAGQQPRKPRRGSGRAAVRPCQARPALCWATGRPCPSRPSRRGCPPGWAGPRLAKDRGRALRGRSCVGDWKFVSDLWARMERRGTGPSAYQSAVTQAQAQVGRGKVQTDPISLNCSQSSHFGGKVRTR